MKLLVATGMALLLVVIGWQLLPIAKRTSLPAHLPEAGRAPRQVDDDGAGTVLEPIPLSMPLPPEKIALGKDLFVDTRFSADGALSCASCHPKRNYGVDGLPVSTGNGGQALDFNAPSIFNVAFHDTFFWNGRAATLEDQVDGPVHDPREFASDWPSILKRLGADADLVGRFTALYGEGPTERTVKDALAVYQRSLITPDSRFDRHLRGDPDALNAQEKEGYRLFTDLGCSSCHQGIGIGGNMVQVFGVMGNYFEDRGNVRPADLGRFTVTGDEFDRHVFKVPSLRNVAETAPYFHDGHVETLEEAVRIMAKYQQGLDLTAAQIKKIVAFLESLTAPLPADPAK